MRFTSLLMFVPMGALPLLVVLAGLALIIGKKQLASTLIVSVLAMAFAPVVLGPVFAALPGWVIAVAIPVMGVMLVGALVSAVFGKRVYENAMGNWLASLLPPLWIVAILFVLLHALL
jgi:hypothetical protein